MKTWIKVLLILLTSIALIGLGSDGFLFLALMIYLEFIKNRKKIRDY